MCSASNAHEANYVDGGADFETPGIPSSDIALNPPKASTAQECFDQDPSSRKAMYGSIVRYVCETWLSTNPAARAVSTHIHVLRLILHDPRPNVLITALRSSNHAPFLLIICMYSSIIKDAIQACKVEYPTDAREAEVNVFLKTRLAGQVYKNMSLTTGASNILRMETVYVTMPGVLRSLKGRPTLADLHNPQKAKYMFSTGDGFGSLRDLVVGKHGTPFPLTEDDAATVWASASTGLGTRGGQ